MDIKVLLQVLNGVWMIDESSVPEYSMLVARLRNGDNIELSNAASMPYTASVSGKPVANGNVMVLPIIGATMKYDYCGSMGTQTMMQYVAAANASPQIQSIVLNVDSPGGAVDGTEEFAKAIENSKKPVVAFVSGKSASAGYWAISGAKEIVIAGETTIVGSIGTMAVMRKGLPQDEQVLFASKSTRKNKAMMDAMAGDTEAYVKTVLDPLNEVFTSAIMRNRAGKIDLAKEDVTEGDIYIGKRAIAVGLADKIGTLDYAIKRSLQLANSIS